MKTSRFIDSQIMVILKEAEASMPAPELCREHGASIVDFSSGAPSMVIWMLPWCLASKN